MNTGFVKCLAAIDTSLLSSVSSGCYELYYTSPNNNKLVSIAKFYSITANNTIQLFHQDKIPTGANGLAVLSCNGKENLLAASDLVDNTATDGVITDSQGTYTVTVEAGKYHTLQIRRTSKDLGNITIDLTSATTETDLEEIKADPSKLAISTPYSFTHTVVVNGPVTNSDAASDSTTSTANVSSNDITTIDIATLTNEASNDSLFSADTSIALSGFSYNSTTLSFDSNTAITNQIPNITGTISSCSVTPTLPVGLVLANDCTLSGTPTVSQAATSYTITASNSVGNVSTTLSIQVYSGLWVQDAYLKASNAEAADLFGVSVDIDGDYAIVGALFEDNLSTTIVNTDNATITDSSTTSNSGAAYIFKRE
ncbi:MAG: FG-GAP repeat protein [Spirochaetota bacterium]